MWIKCIYSLSKNMWSAGEFQILGWGGAEVNTVSILMELRVFGEILCPKLKKKETNVFCKNLGLIVYSWVTN